jgi:Uma2 family endonuclease
MATTALPGSPPVNGLRPGWYSYLDAPPWAGGDASKPIDEVVNGIRVEKKMGAAETRLANILNDVLGPFVRGHNLGRSYVGMEIELPAGGNRRKPDVAFVAEATWPAVRPIPDAWWRVCPELAVEVVSPHELTHATLTKVQEYFAAGVQSVWLVLPHIQQVYCYSSPTQVRILTRADELTGDPVLPGFRIPLAELFPIAAPTP